MQKVRTVIYLDAAQKEELKKLSDKTGATVAELVRRAITSFLASRPTPKPRKN